jgi:hypothetical protein
MLVSDQDEQRLPQKAHAATPLDQIRLRKKRGGKIQQPSAEIMLVSLCLGVVQ